MNEDINLRIKFIQEVERHPYLYDHNHVLYNHRDKIEAAWDSIGQKIGEKGFKCKKKWRLIRCSYTRSLKTQKNLTHSYGLGKGYYMAPHLRFLDPFLKPRSFDNNLSEEEEEQVEDSSSVEVTSDGVKMEKATEEEDSEDQVDDDSSQGYLVEKGSYEGEDCTNPKKRRLEETANRDFNRNEMYLLSLAPYFEDMTELQKLRFQRGVVELIENIKYGP